MEKEKTSREKKTSPRALLFIFVGVLFLVGVFFLNKF